MNTENRECRKEDEAFEKIQANCLIESVGIALDSDGYITLNGGDPCSIKDQFEIHLQEHWTVCEWLQ